jgi:glutaredoxin-related protein
MRGKVFHNYMVNRTSVLLKTLGWIAFLEYLLCRNGTTNFVDIMGMHSNFQMAFEIETTTRHILDNCRKAEAVGIPLCIIVPTPHIYRIACRQVNTLNGTPGGYSIKVFKVSQLEQGLREYLSFFIAANSQG